MTDHKADRAMAAARYKLLFRGKLLAGRDERKVRQQLGDLLKLDHQGLAQLFSGRLITLKRGLLQNEASKYQQLLENLGAEVLLQPNSEALRSSAEGTSAPTRSADSNKSETPLPEDLTCPRCAHSQPQAQQCAHCKDGFTPPYHAPAAQGKGTASPLGPQSGGRLDSLS